MTNCPSCGHATAPGASFCGGCGGALVTPPPAAATPGATVQPVQPAARPTGVTLIGGAMLVVSGIAAVTLVGGLFLILASAAIASAFVDAWFPWLAALGGALLVFAVIGILIGLAFVAFGIVTGIGVLRGRSWAWVATLALMGLNALQSLAELAVGAASGVVGVAVSGVVIWYFFQPDVKAWFGRD